jgi:hypothetical protein
VDSNARLTVASSFAYDTSGVPHIAYYDADTSLIKHAMLRGGSWVTETVGPSDGTHSLSLAFDHRGNPCISYSDGTHIGNLMFAKRTAAGWTTSRVTRGAWGIFGNAGHYSSLAFDQAGNPHIAYIDGSDFASLYYASLNRTTGTWETEKVYRGDSWTSATGFEPSLAFNERGWPYIAFIDEIQEATDLICDDVTGTCSYVYEDRLHLMYTFSYDGETWKTSYLDPGTDDVVRTQSGVHLALDSRGYPHFSYCRKNSDEVNEVRYIAWGGNNLGWIRESVAMLPTEFPATTSIAIDTHNIPHISYISTTGQLMYATRTAPDTWSVSQVDPSISAYSHAIALGKDGHPAIAWVNATGSDLMVAQWIE